MEFEIKNLLSLLFGKQNIEYYFWKLDRVVHL